MWLIYFSQIIIKRSTASEKNEQLQINKPQMYFDKHKYTYLHVNRAEFWGKILVVERQIFILFFPRLFDFVYKMKKL